MRDVIIIQDVPVGGTDESARFTTINENGKVRRGYNGQRRKLGLMEDATQIPGRITVSSISMNTDNSESDGSGIIEDTPERYDTRSLDEMRLSYAQVFDRSMGQRPNRHLYGPRQQRD